MGGERETMVVAGSATATEPELEAVEVEIDDRGGEERQELAHDEAADDGDTERTAEFGARAVAERERKRAEQRSHGGHEDRTETKQAGFVNGFNRREAFQRFRLNGEVDHKDGVFLDDADEEDYANVGDDGELGLEEHEREEGADARGRNCGEDGDWMNETFVQDSENDIDGENGGDEQ